MQASSSTPCASTTTGSSGLCKRIIPCLDIADGRIVKGVKFSNLIDAGDPVSQSLAYEQQGADEIMFLDITASNEGRKTTRALVTEVARQLSIPLTVGGGISAVDDVAAMLDAGADKVSMNTAAVLNPSLIDGVANSFGSQCCVVAIDARMNKETGRWQVLIRGGREDAKLDALDWAKECIARGAGEILLTSWDYDGTRQGFDLKLTKAFSELPVPIIASGGAAGADCFVDVFQEGNADAALAASIFHFSECTVGQIKEVLKEKGVNVRI
jgi:cyclase